MRLLELPNGQVTTANVLVVRKGHDIEGRRFGSLTALRIVERSQAGNVWLLQCDCGAFAVRTVASLNTAIKRGNSSLCRKCLGKLRSEFGESVRARKLAAFVACARRGEPLYTERALERIENDIRSAVIERLGVAPDEPVEALPLATVGLAGMLDRPKRDSLEYEASHDDVARELERFKEAFRVQTMKRIAHSTLESP